MARIRQRTDLDLELDEPVLVEGLPGVGLVGAIVASHLVDALDMTYYGGVECDGIPSVAVYGEEGRTIRPPVRLYADEANDLLVLRSDVPVSREAAPDFSACIVDWLDENDALPLFLSGLPRNQDPGEVPDVHGIATHTAGDLLDEHDVDAPSEEGVVGGPTGALLHRAAERDVDALGLVVESDPQFPDPAAARQLLVAAINPVAGIDVNTDDLVESAEEIREQKEDLAKRMREVSEAESSQAQPLRMFQ